MAEREYQLGNKAKDLLIHTMKLTANTNLFPKHVRFTVVKELQDVAVRIMRNVHAANECMFQTEYRRRIELIKQVLDDCNYKLQLIEVCVELGYIDLRRCEYWSKLVTDVKYISASWRKKETERAKNLAEAEERRKFENQKALLKAAVEEIIAHRQ